MPQRQMDPGRLDGEELRRWYLRTPEEVEREREAVAARRYSEFYSPLRAQPPWSGSGAALGGDPRHTRAERWSAGLGYAHGSKDDARLDYGLVGPDDGGRYVEISSKTERDRRKWEQREGKPWPKTEDGRNFHMHHDTPRGDGGSDDFSNKGPMHPDEHRKHHMERGDFKRWGSRSGQGGGTDAVRGRTGPKLRGLGTLGMLFNFLGILSGRIRTDSFDNFSSDMLGMPSQEDQRKAFEDYQRMLNPNWKPGDPIQV